MNFRGVAIFLEFEERFLPSGCEFCRLAGLDWVRENKDGIIVIEDHDILIYAG